MGEGRIAADRGGIKRGMERASGRRSAGRLSLRSSSPTLRNALLLLPLAACVAPERPTPPTSQPTPEAVLCRDPDGKVVRSDPKIGYQTGLPVPRSIYTKRAATFRAGPKSDEAVLFTLEQPAAVLVLRECGFYRLARAPDGRTGWLQASALTTRAPRASP